MTTEKPELPPFPDEFDGLDAFIVGGWVRDFFREGVEPTDVDIMVAGVSREELLDRGFTEIDSANNDTFGVFQDSLGREVAMAREEVSTGDGHRDFDVQPISNKMVPRDALHRDLKRRDLTINSMAIHRGGEFLDPHDGRQDLEYGIIRVTDSTSFMQDPLRVLRAARFAARLDAETHRKTLELMSDMVDALPALPQERVRIELEKTLKQADKPRQFFEVLADVGALEKVFPELDALRDVQAGPTKYHKEGSAFRHTMMVLDEMAEIRPQDETALLMSLAHDLGKSTTDEEDLPSHPAHGKHGVPVVEKMADRLSMSNEQKNAMRAACRHHMKMQDIGDLRESTVINLVEEEDMETIFRLIDLVEADAAGRMPEGEADVGKMFARVFAAGAAIEHWTGEHLIDEGYNPAEMGGEEFGDLLHQKRVEFMREIEQ